MGPQHGLTERFAEFVRGVTFDDLPDGVAGAIKWLTLDTLAVTVAGAPERGPAALLSQLERQGGAGRATAVGTGLRCDPASAALYNATAGHALDYDDYCFGFSGHPSVVIVPSLFALAEDRGATGRDVITAYAAGFEAAIMLSHAVNPRHYTFGWHGTGTIGTMAATFACARLLELDHDQIMNAIALGVSSCSGLRQNFGTDVKPLHAGNAARAGVMAAQLAEAGFRGDPDILEGRFGFLRVFSPDRYDESSDLSRIGTHDGWRILEPGIVTKLFAACGSTHTAIGGAMQLRKDGLAPDDIEHMDIHVTDVQGGNLQYPRPRTALEGKFSMQYTVARALNGGLLGMEDFTDERVNDPHLDDLISRIDMHVDDALTSSYVWGDHRPAVFAIRLKSGGSMNFRSDSPPGAPGTFTREMLLNKVNACVSQGTVPVDVSRLAAALEDLDQTDDVREITALVSGPVS